MKPRFSLTENFLCETESGLPRSISVEKNSVYTHNHIRREDGALYIACQGNKFFLITPNLADADVCFRFRFHNTHDEYGCALYFRYDRTLRTGYCVELCREKDENFLSLCRIDREEKHILDRIDLDSDSLPDENTLCVICRGGDVQAQLNGREYAFAPGEAIIPSPGAVGMTFHSRIGEMAALHMSVESEDELPSEILLPETSAAIPLRNGGNIPYVLTWSVHRTGGISYLKYRLSGGPGERVSYPGYPRKTGQYVVETARMTSPYIALYSGNGRRLCRNTIWPGTLTVADPGLHWKELLYRYMSITDLPIEGCFPIPEDAKPRRLAFGYERFSSSGYCMQTEEQVEFIFDPATGVLLAEGKAPGAECILVSSPADKQAVRLIPDTAYAAQQVRRHMAENHYFTETEPIQFIARVQTGKPKAFLTVSTELQDAYGDFLADMPGEAAEDCWVFTHAPLPVGVYRAVFTARFGDQVLCRQKTVFEAFDPTGERCAPLESGLPALYSMPNEQQYLDRDVFDPWNPYPGCNMEHYYAISCFAGDIGLKKRIWEILPLFGRKWYVWDSDHRTLTEDEFARHHEEILRHADYCYYPLEHEWAVVRHDFIEQMSYKKKRLMPYLRDFLAEHPEYDIGLNEETENLTREQHRRLMFACYQEWMQYACERIFEDAARDNQWMRSVNPDVKRACYGPFPIYAYPLTTYNSMRYIGFPTDERLSSLLFDGFGQLEDYPFSCAYNTYKGSFLVSHVLLHAPDIAIYPEQYKSSFGGCIDGAVKDAHPPLGKYEMPTYFNVTHAYEFVYNTAHLTQNGFEFWKKRGFMHPDFPEEFEDAFVRGWKHVLHHEPKETMRGTAYLSEIPACEDEVKQDGDSLNSMNRSDAGIAYFYETARTHGLPNGFTFRWDMLGSLTPEMTDCVVLPSLENAPEGAIEALTKLYEAGVSLIAVSRIDGLEEIFGVRYAPAKERICRLCTPDGKEEAIFPDDAQFFYEPAGASVLLEAETPDGSRRPVLLKKGRALLLNAPAPELGHRIFPKLTQSYAPSVSELLRKTAAREMLALSRPTALSDGCGITLFRDEHGHTLLLAIDYSPYGQDGTHREYESTIMLNDPDVKEVSPIYGPAPSALRDGNGRVKGLWLKLRQQECALIKLS